MLKFKTLIRELFKLREDICRYIILGQILADCKTIETIINDSVYH